MCWPSIFSQTTSESSTTAPSTPRSLAQTSSCRPRAALLTPPATSRLVLNTVTSCTCLLTPHQPAATATTTHPSSATCWRPSTHKSSRTSTLSLGAPSCRDTSTNTFSATVRMSQSATTPSSSSKVTSSGASSTQTWCLLERAARKLVTTWSTSTEMFVRTPLSWAAWLLKVQRSAKSQSIVSSRPRSHTATWLVTLLIAHLAQRRTRSCRLWALILASAPSVCVLDTDSEALASLVTTVHLAGMLKASASTQRFQLQPTSTTITTPKS